jgi:acyl dehydratase
MSQLIFFEDLQVGNRWVSESRQVTEADVVQFADLTGDYNPLHLDQEFAKQTPFRQPIAHGLLGLSLLAGLGSNCPRVETVAFLGIRDWRFIRPIYFDDVLHAITTVTLLEPNGRRRGAVTWHRQLLNQERAIVQEGLLQSLVACRRASLHVDSNADVDMAATSGK